MRNANNELYVPNLMVSRHGESANALQKCAQCQHLKSSHYIGDAPSCDFWVCEQFTTPLGRNMPWSDKNAACELFTEREKEE